MYKIFVDASGPVFDMPGPEAIIYRYCRHIEEVLGDMGTTFIRAYLPTQYMYLGHNGGNPEDNPVPSNAGFYQSQIHTERQVPESLIITDTPVVYGPWIEGVSSRNLIVWQGRVKRGLSGRFPGYHTFRVISQVLNDVAPDVARVELKSYVEDLNA